ncbi:Pkr1-domain-containing protein [Zopfia rhizophila CBS 207.26]|uniref:Pkr1-domain-containing protein n=1 Tax=Zopfia rhizophila CBS 207.26 TaxID=1314779 RepID=A0A6A6DEL4_9PEZI|nr:Pkr1-domain-containing protein [Zopfia rhizophila CBS 207.26]
MASFIENLWLSIFTPGPTPTLLVATNVTFAALQLLLLVLLLATYSVHLIILSGLTAGLWWAINWFAGEIRAAQAKEEEAKRIRDVRREKEKGKTGAGSEGEAMDTGDDTEVETEVEEKYKPKPTSRAPRPETQSTVFVEKPAQGGERARGATPVQTTAEPVAASTTGAQTKLSPLVDDAMKKRRSMGESTGELSTDSEWEKLSQDSGER